MDEQDSIGNKFKTTFSSFESEPPDKLWENIRAELHPVPGHKLIWDRLTSFTFFGEKRTLRFAFIAGTLLVVFLTVLYFIGGSRYKIHGYAYAGDRRLGQGTAVLFRVSDKTMPWDSATHYRSAVINNEGRYEFPGITPGAYLLRILLVENSGDDEKFYPSWFEHHLTADSCPLIIVRNDDEKADVHLLKKED